MLRALKTQFGTHSCACRGAPLVHHRGEHGNFHFAAEDNRSENRVAVGIPVSCFLQVLLDVHRLGRLEDFVRGVFLSREDLAAHLGQRGSVLIFPLAAALNDGVPEGFTAHLLKRETAAL